MTAFSMWYFAQRKATEYGPLFSSFMQPLEGGIFAQDAIATRAFTSISTQWVPFYKKQWDKRKQLTPGQNLVMIRDAMRESCGPVLLGLEFDGQKATHSVLATSMLPEPGDPKRVRINIYDPNHPGIERYLRLFSASPDFSDPTFQIWSIYEPTDQFVDQVVLDGWGSLFLGEAFQSILDDALLNPPFGGNQEATINLDSHTDQQQVSQRHQVLTGTIQSSEYLVEKVSLWIESPHTVYKLAGYADLLADDSFEVPIDLDPGDNRLTFAVAFRDEHDNLRNADPVIAGLGGRNDIRLVFDQEPAQINLTSPADGMISTSLVVDVTGTINGGDVPADIIRISSGFETVDIPVVDGNFNGKLKLKPDSTNLVQLYAVEVMDPGVPVKDNVIASNMDGKVLKIKYETPPAKLTLTTPEPGAKVGRTVRLEGTVTGHPDYQIKQLVIDSSTPTGFDGASEFQESTSYSFPDDGGEFTAELPMKHGENVVNFLLLGSFPILNDDLVNIPVTYTQNELNPTGLHLNADFTQYALLVKVDWPFRDQWPRYGTEPWIDGYSDDHFVIRVREPGGAEYGTSGPVGTVGVFGQDYFANRYITYALTYSQLDNFLSEHGSPVDVLFNIAYRQYDRVTIYPVDPTEGYSHSFSATCTLYEGSVFEQQLNAGQATLSSPRGVDYDNWPFDVTHLSVSPTYAITLDDRVQTD